MNAVALLNALRHREIAVSIVGGQLVVRPAAKLTSDDREAIRCHLPELITTLTKESKLPTDLMSSSVPDSWDQQAAIRMMFDADTLVESLGVDGRHPAITATVAQVSRAHAAQNMGALRFALGEFTTLVRKLAVQSESECESRRSA